MNKEEFKTKLLEEQVFQELKDKLKYNTKSHLRLYLVEKGILDKVDIGRLYVRINNYRIKKYGTSVVFKEKPVKLDYLLYQDF